MENTIIVYYSKDGNTRLGANILSQNLGCHSLELIENKKGNVVQALLKLSTKLTNFPWKEIQNYQNVILMSPIWASNGTPAMNAFLKKANFKNKTVHIITFQEYSDFKDSDKVHAYIAKLVKKTGGNVATCTALLGEKMGHCATQDAMKKQIEKLPSFN